MINWPTFTQGEVLGASKLRHLVRCCRDLERLATSCQLQSGVGYTFHRGPGGSSLAIRRSRGGKGGGGMAMPFSCSIVTKTDEQSGKKTQCVQIAKNGGVFLDVMGRPYEIAWQAGEVVEVGGAETPGKFSVCLGWKYGIDYSKDENRSVECKTVGFSAGGDLEEDAALKPVITPIKGAEEMGESQVVLAVGEAKQGKEGIEMSITNQFVFSSLRAYWLPGYVKEEPGALGQYADVSISVYENPKT